METREKRSLEARNSNTDKGAFRAGLQQTLDIWKRHGVRVSLCATNGRNEGGL